jgi:hypothetical protein
MLDKTSKDSNVGCLTVGAVVSRKILKQISNKYNVAED